MSLFKPVLTLTSALTLVVTSGCSLIGDRTSEYKAAEEGSALVVPETLSSEKIRERFNIPDVDSPTLPSGEYELPTPPDATASLSDDPYTLKTFEGESWLELPMPPSKAWPLLDNFWVSYDLTITDKQVEQGFFNSEPLNETTGHQLLIEELEATTQSPIVIEGISLQARVTQGVRRNTSELQARVFLPGTTAEERSAWKATPVTPRIERALLELVGETITDPEWDVRYSLSAINIGDQSRVKLLDDEAGYPYLQVNLRFKRAWAEVLDSLEASPAIISGRERKEGLIYISYLDEEEIDSWYLLDSQLEELKRERNFEVRFYQQEPGLIHVRAKIISDVPEPEQLRALIELIFEYIS